MYVTQIWLVVFFCPKDKVAVNFFFLLLNNRILAMYPSFINKKHYRVRFQTRSWYELHILQLIID